MEKILIIGNLSNTEKNLSDYLSQDYHIQLCTKQLDNIQAMTKILKPALVILSHFEKENDQPILDWFCEKHEIPVLIFLDSKNGQPQTKFFENEQFAALSSPVSKTTLLAKCRQLLSTAGNSAQNKSDRKKILIVDDTPLMLRKLKQMLENTYEVVLAASGKQALHTIVQEAPDLVLLDYEMPEMNGREVFEIMLADEDMKDIPVVFLTSVSDRKSVSSILRSKPAGYILKPAEQENILNTVQEILNKE